MELLQILGNSVSLAGRKEAKAPTDIQMLPLGEFQHPKGIFKVTPESVHSCMEHFSNRVNDIVIDYEHQTEMGVEAPAAGWVSELHDRGKDGLWATVEWNQRAVEYLENREYRYLSPVVLANRVSGEVKVLTAAALTNRPVIDGMEPIINKAGDPPENEKENAMLKKLLAKLGMSEGTPEEKAIEEVSILVALKAKVAEVLGKDVKVLTLGEVGTDLLKLKEQLASSEVLQVLELKDGATLKDIQAKVVALKNPGSYVSRDEFEALQLKMMEKAADDLVDLAMSEGKIAPAQEDWARKYALKDPDGFSAYVEKVAPVVPVGKRPGPPKEPASGTMDEDTLIIAKMMGNTEEDLKKYGGIETSE